MSCFTYMQYEHCKEEPFGGKAQPGLWNQFPVGGEGLGNGPHIPLRTKGVSEAANPFTTALIQPQDLKK